MDGARHLGAYCSTVLKNLDLTWLFVDILGFRSEFAEPREEGKGSSDVSGNGRFLLEILDKKHASYSQFPHSTE